ncbi:hypothetical protein BDV95DRAFT_487724 [Massariosphaeria phaeospora]|uniref:DnaJ homologue subfamily C member 28 conserved domain-containing protein n=1 Tax=Massariosphaeria phaeospora TaxID=100035 RepID=A0A7C8IAG6_9PLEO|nr:hypothetical protein BDV95DRAFT_487724 [Massariosphaeria phaeospora]
MPASAVLTPYICARCLRRKSHLAFAYASIRPPPLRTYRNPALQRKDEQNGEGHESKDQADGGRSRDNKDEGAMTRRLREMSEEALESGGRSAQKAVSEAGFSEELKRQLEEKIASAKFRLDNRSAFAETELSSSANRHTRDLATANPWAGTESIHDASLRMLNDAHKPLRLGRGARVPGPAAKGTGTRLADARDRSGLYSALKEAELDKAEKEKRFQELKDRFSPHARSIVPGTVQGLASIADKRIEDAIARGQFKNLPRGKKLERDYNASNPFLDTTEYFMNKIIQKQDIVPPWIEKQQELVATANKFRSRLRNDWKRHAARVIASKGGTLADQMRKAEAYAKAEEIANPSKKKEEKMNLVDDQGQLSQISLSGELKVPKGPSADAGSVVEEIVAERTTLDPTTTTSSAPLSPTSSSSLQTTTTLTPTPPSPHPFRDPSWETLEHTYHTLAIADLNSKTRSYNLQAPDLAKKPYFSLARELAACYADVAPQLAEAIKERAAKPVRKAEGFGQNLTGNSGVLDRLVGEKVRVRDEKTERRYGFRQLWRDVWG